MNDFADQEALVASEPPQKILVQEANIVPPEI